MTRLAAYLAHYVWNELVTVFMIIITTSQLCIDPISIILPETKIFHHYGIMYTIKTALWYYGFSLVMAWE
jgi:hypothetical protein